MTEVNLQYKKNFRKVMRKERDTTALFQWEVITPQATVPFDRVTNNEIELTFQSNKVKTLNIDWVGSKGTFLSLLI